VGVALVDGEARPVACGFEAMAGVPTVLVTVGDPF
jgi:hypothetical protein